MAISKEAKKEKMSQDTKVTVHFPSQLDVRIVQANELKHYTRFQWLTTLLSSITLGFWTSLFTLGDLRNAPILWASASFTVVTVVVGWLAFKYGRAVVMGDGIKKSIDLSKLE